ncbi:unnamed protein product, partial [Rotaria magnacalcarata]
FQTQLFNDHASEVISFYDATFIQQQWTIEPIDREIVPISAEMDHPNKNYTS